MKPGAGLCMYDKCVSVCDCDLYYMYGGLSLGFVFVQRVESVCLIVAACPWVHMCVRVVVVLFGSLTFF